MDAGFWQPVGPTNSGGKLIDTEEASMKKTISYAIFLSVLLTSTTRADWRGWFDNYGGTYQECIDLQKKELLKDGGVPAKEVNFRATGICKSVWEKAPPKFKRVDAPEGCTQKYGFAVEPAVWKNGIRLPDFRPKEVNFPRENTVELHCPEHLVTMPPGKVRLSVIINGKKTVQTVKFYGYTAYFNAGQKLTDSDEVSVTYDQFHLHTNPEYVRK